MHGSVHRKSLRFPFQNLVPGGSVATPIAMGIPGPAQEGPIVTFARDTKDNAPTGILSQLTQTADIARYRLDLGRGNLPISGIGISPDSPIHSADIALHGQGNEIDRYRISPGNPILGCQEADYATVTLPNPMPSLSLAVTDCAPDSTPIVLTAPATLIPSWPLRLEVFRGPIYPMRSPFRAPWFARTINALSVANGLVGNNYFCVDGRAKIDIKVDVQPADGQVTVTMFAIEPQVSLTTNLDSGTLSNAQVPLALDSSGNLSAVVTDGNPKIFSFNGNPITILLVKLTALATSSPQCACKAYDI